MFLGRWISLGLEEKSRLLAKSTLRNFNVDQSFVFLAVKTSFDLQLWGLGCLYFLVWSPNIENQIGEQPNPCNIAKPNKGH